MQTKSKPQENDPLSQLQVIPLFVPAWVRELLRDLKGAPLSVLVAYGSYSNKDGHAFPSLQTLRRVTGYGILSVKKGRSLLVGMGLLVPIEQERQKGKFGRKIFRVGWKRAIGRQLVRGGTVDRGTAAGPGR